MIGAAMLATPMPAAPPMDKGGAAAGCRRCLGHHRLDPRPPSVRAAGKFVTSAHSMLRAEATPQPPGRSRGTAR